MRLNYSRVHDATFDQPYNLVVFSALLLDSRAPYTLSRAFCGGKSIGDHSFITTVAS